MTIPQWCRGKNGIPEFLTRPLFLFSPPPYCLDICPLILLAKGEEAELKMGMEFKAYVENDVKVKVALKDKLTADEIQQIEKEEMERRERERKRVYEYKGDDVGRGR